MKTIKQIEQRLAAIAQEVNGENADLDALEQEAKSLREERTALLAQAEKRQSILNTVGDITGGTPVVPAVEARDFGAMTKAEVLASPEYRSAFCKSLLGRDMTDMEKRAYTTATESAGAVIPTFLADEILKKAKQVAPLLSEITLLRVPGGVTYAVEGVTNDAAIHTEGAQMTDAKDTMVSVTLTGYEITKYIQISKSVERMAIPDFEAFLVENMGTGLGIAIVKQIINGTGTSAPTGIDKANTWGEANSVTIALASNPTATDVYKLIGLLPGGYDRNAKFLMSKKTLFADFIPLQDKSKNDIVTLQNGTYYVQGYPVLLDDSIKTHEAYLGDLTKYVGNMAEDISVVKDFLLVKNSYEYLAACMFDGKPAIGEAFVKLVKSDS